MKVDPVWANICADAVIVLIKLKDAQCGGEWEKMPVPLSLVAGVCWSVYEGKLEAEYLEPGIKMFFRYYKKKVKQ